MKRDDFFVINLHYLNLIYWVVSKIFTIPQCLIAYPLNTWKICNIFSWSLLWLLTKYVFIEVNLRKFVGIIIYELIFSYIFLGILNFPTMNCPMSLFQLRRAVIQLEDIQSLSKPESWLIWIPINNYSFPDRWNNFNWHLDPDG